MFGTSTTPGPTPRSGASPSSGSQGDLLKQGPVPRFYRRCSKGGIYFGRMSRTIGGAMASRQAVIDIPEEILLAEKTDETSFAREVLTLAAVKLYELGRLSSGRAAQLAGMSRVELLLSLGQIGRA